MLLSDSVPRVIATGDSDCCCCYVYVLVTALTVALTVSDVQKQIKLCRIPVLDLSALKFPLES
jgi:hypothetical protein